MKKFFLFACAWLVSSVFALEINEQGAKVTFTAYKMNNKTAVPCYFKETNFRFQRTSGTVAEILTNAEAIVTLNSVDTVKNPVRDKHVRDQFFANLQTQYTKGLIRAVNGDDTMGEVTLYLDFNGVQKEITLEYIVKEGAIKAEGQISLEEDFKLKKAYEAFANDKVIAGLHGQKSWPDVQIGFEIPLR